MVIKMMENNKMMNHINLAKKWKGFGWNVNIINGHNIKQIANL